MCACALFSPQAAQAEELGWPSPAELLRHVLSLTNVPEGEANEAGEGAGGNDGDEPYSYANGGMATLPEEEEEEDDVAAGAANLGGALEATGSATE